MPGRSVVHGDVLDHQRGAVRRRGALQAGETGGFGPEDHLAVLAEHAPDLKVHTVLADRGRVGTDLPELEHVVAAYGARLVVDDVAADDGSPRHDPRKLGDAYARILARG